MKRIDDVEKLKELIMEEKHREENVIIFSKKEQLLINAVVSTIIRFIDSLAVEVPEAKPGAIVHALEAQCANCREKNKVTVDSTFYKCDNCINPHARAEFAQLQAENVYLKQNISDIASDNERVNDENTNLKGALRTLANEIRNPDCSLCEVPTYECEKQTTLSCKETLIAYALEHPIEEGK